MIFTYTIFPCAIIAVCIFFIISHAGWRNFWRKHGYEHRVWERLFRLSIILLLLSCVWNVYMLIAVTPKTALLCIEFGFNCIAATVLVMSYRQERREHAKKKTEV